MNLSGADLTDATLSLASFVETDLRGATLIGCKVYGIAAWDVKTDDSTVQSDLVIATASGLPLAWVDDIEVAQLIYMLSRSDKLRRIIDTLGSRGVLIIGRFTPERLKVLHAVRDALRKRHDLLPIMFDFDPQASKTTLDTLMTLAYMSRFVIADVTDARAVVQELTKITDNLRSLPIKLIMDETAQMPSMSDSFLVADSILKPVYRYASYEQLLADLEPEVIGPAEAYAKEFEARLAELRLEYVPWQSTTK
ncbi:MAG: pentapeptide repeat-containing protein [Candidatus Thiodiazotropha sp.]